MLTPPTAIPTCKKGWHGNGQKYYCYFTYMYTMLHTS